VVGPLGDGEDVGRDLIPPLAPVELDGAGGVDGEPLVGVHRDTEEARVSLTEDNQFLLFSKLFRQNVID
jgi:hypothetical protein